jgi:hypothetical protein
MLRELCVYRWQLEVSREAKKVLRMPARMVLQLFFADCCVTSRLGGHPSTILGLILFLDAICCICSTAVLCQLYIMLAAMTSVFLVRCDKGLHSI